MAETQEHPTNYCKAFFALGLTLGNFIPYTVLMVFSSQLYKQLDFDNLGFYVLAVSSFSGALMNLLAPGIIFSMGSKHSIILSSFGMTLWICGYIIPFMCNNTKNVGNGICDHTLIICIILIVSFIGGGAQSLFMVSVFSYICSWSRIGDIPFLQSFFYSAPICGKIISSTSFSLSMKTPTSQYIFFICISAISFVTSCVFIFLPKQRQKEDILEEENKLSFGKIVCKKIISTMKLIINTRMLLFLPFLLFLSFIRETKLSVLSVMLNEVMEGTDRLVINQKTGYINICESLSCVPFGIVMGKVVQSAGKRISIYIDYFLGIYSFVFILVIYYRSEPYSYLWYFANINYAFSLGFGLIIQYSISATEFENKEIAFGTASFLSAIASSIIQVAYTLMDLSKFYIMAAIFFVVTVIGAITITKFSMRKITETLPLRF